MMYDEFKRKALMTTSFSEFIKYLKTNRGFVKDDKLVNLDKELMHHMNTVGRETSKDVDSDGFDIELF